MFGGRGTFEDALLLVGWLQVIMLGLQALQLVALVILPPLAEHRDGSLRSPVLLDAQRLHLALHGFQSRLGA
jgi:hypothetical protein